MTMQALIETAPRSGGRSALRLARRGVRLIGLWRQRAQDRRALRAMSPRELWDIRLTRVDAQREAKKPFWRA